MIKGSSLWGYRPQVDWGAEGASATLVVGGHNVQVGTSGWRKRGLFLLLVLLLIIATTNLCLTLWVISKLSLHTDGAGKLQVFAGGISVNGITNLQHNVTVGEVKGRTSSPLVVEGYYNVTLSVEGIDGTRHNRTLSSAALVINTDGVSVLSQSFAVKENGGDELFAVDDNGSRTGAQFFTVTGDEGADIYGSLQTPRLLGNDVHEFKLESTTKQVKGRAGVLVRAEAVDGDVAATALHDVSLTTGAKIRFESPNVFVPKLMDASRAPTEPPMPELQIPAPQSMNPSTPMPPVQTSNQFSVNPDSDEELQIFQVCVCPNGKLFLSPSEAECVYDESACR